MRPRGLHESSTKKIVLLSWWRRRPIKYYDVVLHLRNLRKLALGRCELELMRKPPEGREGECEGEELCDRVESNAIPHAMRGYRG